MSANATNSERECVNTIPEKVSVALLKTKLALYSSITLIKELEVKGQDITAFAPYLDAFNKAYIAAAKIETTRKRALEGDSQERPEAEEPSKKKAKSPQVLAEPEEAVTDDSDDSDTKEDQVYELYIQKRFGEFKLLKMYDGSTEDGSTALFTGLLKKDPRYFKSDGYFINTETEGDLISALRALYDNKEIYKFAWVDDGTLYLENLKTHKLIEFASNVVFIHWTSYEFIQREREYVKDSNATQPYKEVVQEVNGETHRIEGRALQLFYSDNRPVVLGDRVMSGKAALLASIHNIEVKYYYGGTYNDQWYELPEGWVAHVTVKYKDSGKTETTLVPVGTPTGPSLAKKNNDETRTTLKQNYLPDKKFYLCDRAMSDMETRKSDDEFLWWYCPYIWRTKLHGVQLMPIKKGDTVTRWSEQLFFEHDNPTSYKIKKVYDDGRVTLQKWCDGVLQKDVYLSRTSDLIKCD